MKKLKNLLLALVLLMAFTGIYASPCSVQLSINYQYLGGSEYNITVQTIGISAPRYFWMVADTVPSTQISYGSWYRNLTVTLAPGATSEIEVTVTDTVSGCTGTDSISITAPNCSFFDYMNNTVIGSTEDVLSLNGGFGGTPPYTYSWPDGSTGPTDTVTFNGIYSVTVTDSNGCQAFPGDTVTNLLACTQVGNLQSLSVGTDRDSLTVTYAGGAGNNYVWSTGFNGPFIDVANNGIYSVTVYNLNAGCSAVLSDTISNLPCSIADHISQQYLPDGKVLFTAFTSGAAHPIYTWQLPDGTTVTTEADTISSPLPASFLPPLIVTIQDSGTSCIYTDSAFFPAIAHALSVSDIQEHHTITVAPDPFRDHTTISVSDMEAKDATLELYNIMGQRVYVSGPVSGGSFRIERGSLSAGIYIYHIRQGEESIGSGKLVVER